MAPETLSSHLVAARVKSVPTFVRVTGPNAGDNLSQPWGAWIKPVLDAGADGIIAPQVRTRAEVEGIVADCRFPPTGRRGRGFLGGHFDYGRVDPDQYMAEADAQIFVRDSSSCPPPLPPCASALLRPSAPPALLRKLSVGDGMAGVHHAGDGGGAGGRGGDHGGARPRLGLRRRQRPHVGAGAALPRNRP